MDRRALSPFLFFIAAALMDIGCIAGKAGTFLRYAVMVVTSQARFAAIEGSKKELNMKVDLKSRLAVLPLLACSTAAVAAEPVLLGARDMDRITAGAQQVVERLASVIMAAQDARSSIGVELSALAGDQLAWLTQLASSGPVTLRREASGELVATRQLQSGDQWVIVRQLSAAEAAALPLLTQGDAIATRSLQPGETLTVQQNGTSGINYLYIHSTGNSSVTVSQHHL